MKRTLVTDQTLEPTQVAGFNQFFDDPTATQSEVWGGARPEARPKRLFAGAEYSERDLTIPHLLLQDGLDLDAHGEAREREPGPRVPLRRPPIPG